MLQRQLSMLVCVHAHNSVRGAKLGQTCLIEMSILKPPKFLISPRPPSDNQDASRLSKGFSTKLRRGQGKKEGPATVTCMPARAHALARLSGKLDLKADNF